MKIDLHQRFGFLVNEVGRLYGRRFDQLARQRLGLTRAQVRLLAMVALNEGRPPLTQAELAHRLDLTPMAVAKLCDRLQAAGWIARQARPADRRAWSIELQPVAHQAVADALALGDEVQAEALAGLPAAERRQLVALLQRAHANLQSEGGAASPAPDRSDSARRRATPGAPG